MVAEKTAKSIRGLLYFAAPCSVPNTGTLEHCSQVCENLFSNIRVNTGYVLRPLEASALGGRTPALDGKVR